MQNLHRLSLYPNPADAEEHVTNAIDERLNDNFDGNRARRKGRAKGFGFQQFEMSACAGPCSRTESELRAFVLSWLRLALRVFPILTNPNVHSERNAEGDG